VLGESVAAVAIEARQTNWNVSSIFAAVLGFAAVAAVWWLYYEGMEGVALRGSTMSVVVYSYAHIPLLIGLAALGAGLRLLIEEARADHLAWGSAVALLGGVVIYLVSLIGMRTVTIQGGHRRGISLKLIGAGLILGLLAAESSLPPVAVAAGLAVILGAVVFADRTLRAHLHAAADGSVPGLLPQASNYVRR
jgi:low temperature requirement protein LtrA